MAGTQDPGDILILTHEPSDHLTSDAHASAVRCNNDGSDVASRGVVTERSCETDYVAILDSYNGAVGILRHPNISLVVRNAFVPVILVQNSMNCAVIVLSGRSVLDHSFSSLI